MSWVVGATIWFVIWVICLWLVWRMVDRKDLNRALWMLAEEMRKLKGCSSIPRGRFGSDSGASEVPDHPDQRAGLPNRAK